MSKNAYFDPIIAAHCDPLATAIRIAGRYMVRYVTHSTSGYFAMMTYVMSDGRLFALKPSEWFLMLTGVTLTGLLTLVI